MKFSDLIVLGSTMISLDPTVYLEDGRGCFMGMAAAAKTGATTCSTPYQIFSLFPWLKEPQRRGVHCPGCTMVYPDYANVISCVCMHVRAHDMTFEQGLKFVRAIEPNDECQTVYAFLCPQRVSRVEETSGTKPVE